MISLIISAVIAVAMAATFVVMLRTTETTTRVLESNDVMLLTATLATDVNGMTELTSTPCGGTAGQSAMFGMQLHDDGRIISYADPVQGTIQRRHCDQANVLLSSRTLVRSMAGTLPTITCDGGACTDGTSPAEIAVVVTESSGFSYVLVGAKRYAPGGGGAASPIPAGSVAQRRT